jgi:hypothetical protein
MKKRIGSFIFILLLNSNILAGKIKKEDTNNQSINFEDIVEKIKLQFEETLKEFSLKIDKRLDGIETRLDNLEKVQKINIEEKKEKNESLEKIYETKTKLTPYKGEQSLFSDIAFENKNNTFKNFKHQTENHKKAHETLVSLASTVFKTKGKSGAIFIHGKGGKGKHIL